MSKDLKNCEKKYYDNRIAHGKEKVKAHALHVINIPGGRCYSLQDAQSFRLLYACDFITLLCVRRLKLFINEIKRPMGRYVLIGLIYCQNVTVSGALPNAEKVAVTPLI